MFRASTWPSSGGKIVFTQHLVSSLSVNVCTVHWLRADSVRSQPVYCADVYRERKYQMLCEYNFSSWRWSCWCSKHVEDNSVTNILLMNKETCALKLVDEIILYYDARSNKHQTTLTSCRVILNFIKTFIIPTDTHYYKNHSMLKQILKL